METCYKSQWFAYILPCVVSERVLLISSKKEVICSMWVKWSIGYSKWVNGDSKRVMLKNKRIWQPYNNDMICLCTIPARKMWWPYNNNMMCLCADPVRELWRPYNNDMICLCAIPVRKMWRPYNNDITCLSEAPLESKNYITHLGTIKSMHPEQFDDHNITTSFVYVRTLQERCNDHNITAWFVYVLTHVTHLRRL